MVKKQLFNYLGIFILLFLQAQILNAQVTIGSSASPNEGALLDLKENTNQGENAHSGLLLPRVSLVVKGELFPMFESTDPTYNDAEKEKHAGLVVYNTTTDVVEDLCPGPYVWNSKIWTRIWGECTFFDFICSSVATKNYTNIEGVSFNYMNSISYNSLIEKNIANNKFISYDEVATGLGIIVISQKIEKKKNGSFSFIVYGGGTTPVGSYDIPLAKLSSEIGVNIPSSCVTTVNITSRPSVLSIVCPPTTPLIGGSVGTEMTELVSIPYTVEGTLPYSLKGITTTLDQYGLVAKVEDQLLNTASGNIIVTISGTPTANTGGIYSWAIPVGDAGVSCNVNLSIISPPPAVDCDSPAYGLVFEQAGSWYAVGVGTTNTVEYARVYGPYATEDEALRDPNAIQYCAYTTGKRCVSIYKRDGTRVLNRYFSIDSYSDNALGRVSFTTLCTPDLYIYPGGEMRYEYSSLQNRPKSGGLGVVKDGNIMYLGIVSGTGGKLSGKGLLY